MVCGSGMVSRIQLSKLLSCFIMCRKLGGGDFRLIYRHYATLYFVFCVDASESELGILDLIQVFFGEGVKFCLRAFNFNMHRLAVEPT